MKHTSKKNTESTNLDSLNTSINDDILLTKETKNINSHDLLNFSTENIINEEEKDFNEFLSSVSNAYYYTGKGSSSINFKAILSTLLGIIVLTSSTFLYINNKSNFNIYIGATCC